jgi:hypothetical protein
MPASIPALLIASFITTLPNVAQFESFSAPPKAPMAVLHAETITTSFMAFPSYGGRRFSPSSAHYPLKETSVQRSCRDDAISRRVHGKGSGYEL